MNISTLALVLLPLATSAVAADYGSPEWNATHARQQQRVEQDMRDITAGARHTEVMEQLESLRAPQRSAPAAAPPAASDTGVPYSVGGFQLAPARQESLFTPEERRLICKYNPDDKACR